MPSILRSCPRSLELLRVFLRDDGPGGRLALEMIHAAEVPQPFHGLLVHERDMTSTLTEAHGEEISLVVLEQRTSETEVVRHVVLSGRESGRPLEYGASRIRLDALPASALDDVLEGKKPLGGILNAEGTPYGSCPGGFLRVRPDEQIARALGMNGRPRPEWLFGRCNCLTRGDGGTIAEVVEILPP